MNSIVGSLVSHAGSVPQALFLVFWRLVHHSLHCFYKMKSYFNLQMKMSQLSTTPLLPSSRPLRHLRLRCPLVPSIRTCPMLLIYQVSANFCCPLLAAICLSKLQTLQVNLWSWLSCSLHQHRQYTSCYCWMPNRAQDSLQKRSTGCLRSAFAVLL